MSIASIAVFSLALEFSTGSCIWDHIAKENIFFLFGIS
jgi:hypothetical protein